MQKVKSHYLEFKTKALKLIESKYFYIVLIGILIIPTFILILKDDEFIPANSLIIQQEDGTFKNINENFVIEFGIQTLEEFEISTEETAITTTQKVHTVRFSAYPEKETPFLDEKETEIKIGFLNTVGETVFGVDDIGIEFSFVGGEIDQEFTNLLSDDLTPNIDTSKSIVDTRMELISSGRVLEANQQGYSEKLEEGEEIKQNKDTIIQEDVIPGVDIVYQVIDGVGLKEEIIINSMEGYSIECTGKVKCQIPRNSYTFNLKLDEGVNLQQSKSSLGNLGEGTYYFEDDNGRYLFHFLSLFAEDKAGALTTNVILDIQPKENEGEFEVKVILDLKWLLDNSREFPIRIDPSIVHDTSAEFTPGIFNRVKDVGTTTPELITYYQELPTDEHTVGLWHMNEGAVNTCSGGINDICDSSGNSNDGAFAGTTAFNGSGKLGGNSIVVDGNSDYITVTENDLLDPKEITIEAWINPTVIQTGNFVDKGGNSGYRLRTHSMGIQFLDRGGVNIITSTIVPEINTWTHVALTGDASGLKLYLNGELNISNSVAYGSPNTATDLILGAYAGGTSEFYNGLLDEIRISNIARTPEEIKASASRRPYSVYTSEVLDLGGNVSSWGDISWNELGVNTGDGENLFDTTNLIAQWNFNETSGVTADNAEGTTAYDGTLQEEVSSLYGDGTDGAVTFSSNTDINTTNRISGRTCTQGGDAVNYSVSSLSTSSAVVTLAPGADCLVAGDEVLIINLQGISSAYTNVGNYEILEVASISGTTVNFTSNKTNYYGNGGTDDTNIGTATTNQRVMLQRVPNYTNVTVNGGVSVYPTTWNGIKGGVLAFKANGTTTVNGTIHANSKGYRGGAGGIDYGKGKSGGSICMVNTITGASSCGGGSGGTGLDCSGSGCDDRVLEAGSSGSASSGGSGGGGGAAAGYSTRNAPAGGGGGGGYGSLGYGGEGGSNPGGYATNGQDGFNGGTNISGNGGYARLDQYIGQGGGGGGGGTYGSVDLSDIFLGTGGAGGGGGDQGGTINNPDSDESGYAGGIGGGIVYIYTDTLITSGIISANGQSASTVDSIYSGSGGGGAGGSILLKGDTISLTGVSATYGNGGPSQFDRNGGGGNGGNGRIAAQYATSWSGSSSPTANVTQIAASEDTGLAVWTQDNQRWGTSALQFDGSNDYVETTTNPTLGLSNAITIEAWINPNIVTQGSITSRSNDGATPYGWNFSIESDGRIRFWTAPSDGLSTGGFAYSNTSIKDNTWNHVVGVIDGSNNTVYLNGVAGTTTTRTSSTINNGNQNINIGRWPSDGWYFGGIIDSTRIYSRALSTGEIISNYNSSNLSIQTRIGSDNTPDDGDWSDWSPDTNETTLESFDDEYQYNTTDTGLVSYWPMDENNDNSCTGGEDACDVSGSNHGIASGTEINDGAFSSSRSFDGINNYITLMDDSTADALGTTFSIELWFKSETTNGNATARIISRDCSDFFCSYINQSTDYPQDLVFYRDGTSGITTYTAVINEKWNHLVSTWDGSNTHLYLNGNILETSAFGSFDATDRPIILGDNTEEAPNPGASPFKGEIDEVRIYNSAISASTVHQHYLQGSTNPSMFASQSEDSIIMEGTRSEEIETGRARVDANTVLLYHLDGTTSDRYDSSISSNVLDVFDSSVNGFTGEFGDTSSTLNTPALVNGISGKARDFDGIDDYIIVPASSEFDLQNLTIEAWVYSDNFIQNGFIFEKTTNGAVNTQYSCFFSSNGTFTFRTYNSTSTIDSLNFTISEYLRNGQWNHVVCSYDGVSKNIYVNGVLATSKVYSEILQTNPAGTSIIGAYGSGDSYFFNGSIDEIKISNIARTPTEIAESYRMGRDHYLNKTVATVDLSNKDLVPFYIAADRPGSYINMTIGESEFVNYQPDVNTIGLWHLDDVSDVNSSGGTISYDGGDTIHKFTSSGTLNLNTNMNLKYLVVGGGGGGAGTGSGGGAGGYASDNFFDILGSSYAITVGAGGAGGISTAVGSTGASSIFSTITATGGGGGRSHGGAVGGDGASGGGAPLKTVAPAATGGISTSQGNNGGAGYVDGGWVGNNGGGGGAGGVGAAGGNSAGTANGGIGLANSITGSSVYYAGGGGGGEVHSSFVGTGGNGGGGSGVVDTHGTSATVNTGGGGGGGSYAGYFNGGNGGSGVVIIRHASTLSTDSSGSNNTLGDTGTTLIPGKLGMARSFNGSSNYLSPNNTNLMSKLTGKNITLDYWFKTTNHTNATWGSIASFNTSTGDNKLLTGIYNSKLSIYDGGWNEGTVTVTDGKWHHVAIILNDSSNTITTYIDGIIDQSAFASTTSIASTDKLFIGMELDGAAASDFFNGDVDEVRISDIARSASEIQQTYEIGRRAHQITIDFGAALDSSITLNASLEADLSFSIDATKMGLSQKGSNLYPGDKIIIQETFLSSSNKPATYTAQATVETVNVSTGAITVSSWDTGSTFPPYDDQLGGFPAPGARGFLSGKATVFKWQREYMDLSDQINTHVDAIDNITFRLTDGHESRTIWIDGLQSNTNYLTNPLGSTISSATGQRYLQYRTLITSSDEAVSSSLAEVTFDYSIGPALDQIMRHGKWFDSGVKQDYWWADP